MRLWCLFFTSVREYSSLSNWLVWRGFPGLHPRVKSLGRTLAHQSLLYSKACLENYLLELNSYKADYIIVGFCIGIDMVSVLCRG